MKFRSTRGAIDVAVAAVVVLLGLIFFGGDIKAKFQHRGVEKAEQRVEQAKDKIAAAKGDAAKEDAQQIESAHKLIAGANVALAKVPNEHRTAEVEVAAELGGKAESAIAAGRNADLTPEQRAIVAEAVAQMLSPVIEENRKGRETIATLEKGLNESVNRESQLRERIAELDAKLAARQTELSEKTHEALASSAALQNVWHWIKVAALAYVVLAWGLPLATKFFPALAPVNRGAQWLLNQSGAAAHSALTATVRGVERVRQQAKTKGTLSADEIKAILADEIYDANDARVQDVRRQEGFV